MGQPVDVETDQELFGIFNGENALSSQGNVSLTSQERLSLSTWGLPDKVLQFYQSKGITRMFEWQLECLTLGGVLDSGNLVYSAPTSAGKTLVAEILIAKTVFEVQRKALVILPFVSVVREKMFYFQNMYASSGIHVEGYMGGHTPCVSFKQVSVAVCTIEKANSIINRLLEEQDIQNLGLVVVDELHLLGDPYRGYLLELLLTKLKYICLKSNFKIQIVGMSATLPNLKSLADWLQASLYYTDFRPVPLREKLKCGTVFYDKQMNKVNELTLLPSEAADDSENVGQLCVETISNGHSILIFCPTKVWCENLADKIALFFRRNGCSKTAETEGTPGWILRKELDMKKINAVIEHLKMSPVGLDKDLHRTVSYGVAFHHAGLTLDERDIIEGSFRQGSIRVLCATSTLSSGVNLPARRVIIRSPMSFGGLMDILTYRQMIGRAGRMGVDSEGESILICKPNERALCQTLMCSTLKRIESCLGYGRLSASLKRALLEIIASGIATTPEDVKIYADCTFLAFSSKHNIQDPIMSCIEFLEENEFIRLQENGTLYSPTPLGKACLASSLPPDEGLALFRELQRARRCFVLDTDLHIIYQVTPYSVSEQWSKVDWLKVLNMLEVLPPSMKRVGEMVGVEEGFLVRIVKGTVNASDQENKNKLSIHRRFYTSLALQELVNEVPLSEVAEKFECNKGMLQSLQQSAATYAGMVTEFTKCLGWNSVELIFSQFQERLQFGIQRELCDLMRLPLLNAMRARVLFNSGFTSLAILANSNIVDVENAFFGMAPFQSKKEIAGETTYEKDKRNKLEAIWVTGKADLTVRQAAELLVIEARNILELELGLEHAKWGRKDSSFSESFNKSISNKSVVIQPNHRSTYLEKSQLACAKADQTFEREHSRSLSKTIKINNGINVTNKIMVMEANNSKAAENICDISSTNVAVSGDCIKNCEKETDKVLNVCDIEMNALYESIKKESEERKEDITPLKANVSNISNVIETDISNSSKANHKQGLSFNFTSSFIFDMIPDYIANDGTNDAEENLGNDDFIQSPPVTPRPTEVSYNEKIQSDSKLLSASGLSEDMFDKMNNSGKNISTPIQAHSIKRLPGSGGNKINVAEVSSPDLFSQSLTFDTQMGRILDFEEPAAKGRQSAFNPSTSFNSDDLGFVSDLSPQHLRKAGNPSALVEPKQPRAVEFKPLVAESSFVEPAIGNGREQDIREGLKRKIESPDLIVDSDESSTDVHHVSKRIKRNPTVNKNSKFQSSTPVVVNDSDDEIMPTPKIGKLDLSSISNISRLRATSLRSFNSSFMKRTSQRSKLISQASGRLRRAGSQTRKKKNETSVNQINKVKLSLPGNCRTEKLKLDKVNIIDVCDKEEDFRLFCEKLSEQTIVGMAIGCRRKLEEKKNLIGSRIIKKRKIETNKSESSSFHYKDTVLDGVAFYWKQDYVSYLSLDDRIVSASDKINFLKGLCHKKNTFRIFDVREQIKMLQRCCSVLLTTSYQDPKVGYWLLSESWKEKNFSSIALEYLPGSKNLISQLGSIVGFSSPGLLSKSLVFHQTRACLEAYLTYHMIDKQIQLLHAKGLEQAFVQTEMPIMLCLAEMELHGFQICRNSILEYKEKLDAAQEALEQKAYCLAGHKFSITSSAAISKVLFKELNLKVDSVPLMKKKKLMCTNKQVLQDLAEQTKHPLPEVILQWRKIRSITTKFVTSLLQTTMDSTRVFGVSQTYTVTGRISMHEPNLQTIPKFFAVGDEPDETFEINLRDIFVASKNCILLSADYSQIELRILAHLSRDAELIKNIVEAKDIFVSIAANVYGIPHYDVDETLRQRAKQTCYGMIYGVGAKTLSQQIGIDESDAATLLQNFKNKYTGVINFTEQSVNECKRKGYVTTLLGRRRYLPAIKDTNPTIRAEAERQAINTIVQGSAADLIKTAMITWREKVSNLMLNGITIYFVLHLHDELIFEVQEDVVEAVAAVLKETMEGAMELAVPTPVKIKTGSSWGQLKNYEF
ncbi:hypothetical protein RUM43_009523 [Polyplax serrata]|uniref:DNA polymerase theta n=1 Tax=Polyplax serrata TaxID=468196 RepID=A0AAN8S189_POLSC